MSARHTPGPWVFALSSDPAFSHSIGTASRMVAKAHAWAKDSGDYMDADESVANARLIAASPKMGALLLALSKMPQAQECIPQEMLRDMQACLREAGLKE